MDYIRRSDVQQTRAEYEKRASHSIGVAKEGDVAACMFGRVVGLGNQALPASRHLVWHEDGSRHLVTETHDVKRVGVSRAAKLDARAAEDVGLTIDSVVEIPDSDKRVYHMRRFHHVVCTPEHVSPTLFCCKHIIAAAEWFFCDRFSATMSHAIGWGYAQRDTVQIIRLNGQVAVVAMSDEGF